MASLCNDGGRKWRILFIIDGQRKQVKFSGFNRKQADTLYHVVARLAVNVELQTAIDPQDATWLSKLSDNPFEAQVSASQANRSRDFHLTPESTAVLLENAPDNQWRLLISLWRLAGLRKMEVFNLTWGDVLWSQGKVRVRSSKTAHKEGCEIRYVPIRDIEAALQDAFNAALSAETNSIPADEAIITRFAASNNNLDKPLKQIIEKAGMILWPKLFQNMRASCETQWLKDGHRADLVANWIGHSVKVQRQNYVQHTQDDIDTFNAKPAFEKGAQSATESDDMARKGSQECAPLPIKTHLACKNAGQKYPEQDSNLQPAA